MGAKVTAHWVFTVGDVAATELAKVNGVGCASGGTCGSCYHFAVVWLIVLFCVGGELLSLFASLGKTNCEIVFCSILFCIENVYSAVAL